MIQMSVNGETSLFVLEPGNIRKLKEGKPLILKTSFGEVIVTYSPDVEWVAREVSKVTDGSVEKIGEIIEQSLTRKEIDRTDTPIREPFIKNVRQ